MENEWLDIACINHEKYIMHGQIDNGIVDCISQTVQIEQVLTPEQKREVDDLFYRHERELRALLKGFIK